MDVNHNRKNQMPYKIEYLEEQSGIITTYWGVITDEDIYRSGREKSSQLEKIKTYRYALTDLSGVEKFDLTPEGIKDNAGISSDIFKVNDGLLVAFVLPTVVEYGMGRIWQAYADHEGKRSQIFKTRSEAELWVTEKLKSLP